MTSLAAVNVRTWKRLVAVIVGLSVLIASLAAMDGATHQFFHGGELCEDNSVCAIAMFGSGSVGAPSAAIAVTLPRRGFEAMVYTAESAIAVIRVVGRPTARGPPRSFLSGR